MLEIFVGGDSAELAVRFSIRIETGDDVRRNALAEIFFGTFNDVTRIRRHGHDLNRAKIRVYRARLFPKLVAQFITYPP